MNDNGSRDFKGVWIPKEIWLDDRLNALDKIILIEIDSLDSSNEGCFATNEYIAEFCQCSITKVSTSISKLINYDYLYVFNFDGRKRYLKSRLSKNERQTFKICKADFQNLKDNNINNNKDININNNTTTNIYTYLEENFGRTISSIEIQKLDEWLLLFNEEIIKHSIDLSCLNNKKTMLYINGILRNWKSCGFKTLQDILDDEEKHTTNQTTYKSKYHNDGYKGEKIDFSQFTEESIKDLIKNGIIDENGVVL